MLHIKLTSLTFEGHFGHWKPPQCQYLKNTRVTYDVPNNEENIMVNFF